jgi:hypothetical protein
VVEIHTRYDEWHCPHVFDHLDGAGDFCAGDWHGSKQEECARFDVCEVKRWAANKADEPNLLNRSDGPDFPFHALPAPVEQNLA